MKDSFWSGPDASPDTYSLFRGQFRLHEPAEVEIRVVGSACYEVWLDGDRLLEGPFRFALDRPEYQTEQVLLQAGDHVLACHAHHIGVETRILKDTTPFLWWVVTANGAALPIAWRCLPLVSQASGTRRINPQLGWIEWRDTRLEPAGWEKAGFDDAEWHPPVMGVSSLPEPTAADLAPVRTFVHALTAESTGPLATTFGYATDDPAFVFHSRDRVCAALPAKGVWRRYDLGRVRLGRPRFLLDLPAGAIVEFALAESRTDGRVSPYINLSAGTSCNLDRHVARGGEQELFPLTPKGGRFLEVHVVNAREGVRFLKEEFLERCYHPPTEAAFTCGDPLLEKIWEIGIETYRACAEDAIVDNPTRERGQWVGDVASVGSEIASIAYGDLRLCKRALVQAALCRREDGLVAGMSPGGCVYLPTYAFQWVVAALDYFRLTGERTLLEELWEPALANMEAIRAFWRPDGLHHVAGWNFVDWGYRADDGPIDLACNLHYLWCLRAMRRWADVLGRDESAFDFQEKELAVLLGKRIAERLAEGGWNRLGYHCATLAMRLGLIDGEEACLDYLQAHLLGCFPNDPEAPRNDDPQAFNARLITPYFAHYVMPLFIERGRMDFVLGQYRKCWGEYMLADGRTTWLEVFDTRWSHCHQWAGCPTWQMSRYLLGLHPRLDSGPSRFHFLLEPGSLERASGRIPHPEGEWIRVEWSRDRNGLHYRIATDRPLILAMPDGSMRTVEREEAFVREEFRLPPGDREPQANLFVSNML